MRYKPLFWTILILAILFFPTIGYYPLQARSIRNTVDRTVSLNINVVLFGLSQSQLNMSSLSSNSTSLSLKYQTILAGPIDTGVIFNFKYHFSFADNSIVANFASFLSSIALKQDTYALPTGYPAFNNPYFSNSTTLSVAHNYFYDSDKVQQWLKTNSTFITPSTTGYTLFIADLHNYGVPSYTYTGYQNYTARCFCPSTVTAHYYNRTVIDPDLSLKLSRHYMTGWGGTNRFEYLDLSAGPSYWTNELPLQVAGPLRGVDTSSYYGRIWTTKFVASYVAGAVDNLFGTDQLYPVNYSQNYVFQIFVIDNRTSSEKTNGPNITTTLNRTFIQSQLAGLLEFSTVNVNVKYTNVNDYPGLAKVIANATTTIRDPSSGRPIVDGQIVYDWFTTNGLGHIRQFINVTRSFSEIDVPAFLFALKQNYTFGFPFKEFIASNSARATFAGEALGDMALIGLGQSDLTLGNNVTSYNQPGKGIGFTHATVHELGHMVGLNHPFIYDITDDFVNTVMGYYAYSLTYSQFDHDTILRGVNDELLTYAQQTLSNTPSNVFNAGSISQAQQNIAKANQLYDSMQYAAAISYSLTAAQAALQASQSTGGSTSTAFAYTLLGVLIGAGVGLLVGYIVFRRRKTPAAVQYNLCQNCQYPLRWDAVQMHWLCDRCHTVV